MLILDGSVLDSDPVTNVSSFIQNLVSCQPYQKKKIKYGKMSLSYAACSGNTYKRKIHLSRKIQYVELFSTLSLRTLQNVENGVRRNSNIESKWIE